jgi:choline dehydrogenase
MTVVQYRVTDGGARSMSQVAGLAWLARYALFGAGPLTHPPVHCGGFVRSRAGLARPDLQFHVVPWGLFTPNTDERRNSDSGRFLSILPGLIYPASRGEIRLRSADPFAAPLIEPRYLSAPEDLDVLMTGVKLSREIAAAKPLARYCGSEARPGKQATTDDALRAEIHLALNTIFHPVGTCKMGTDDLAVVDPELRVRGLDRLRVVDGSIMPTIVGGNTHAPIVMIAEKAADKIRSSLGGS